MSNEELAEFRKGLDRLAGLYNDRVNGSSWRSFLEGRHEMVMQQWPAIRDAVVDARRWEEPCNFNGSFAEKVERAKPLPAISTIGQLERLVIRALVMLGLDADAREELIKASYEAEREAKRLSEMAASAKKPTGIDRTDEVDLSSIQL